MTGLSDSARAFRNQMDGLLKEHASSMQAVEKRWTETQAAADKSAKELTERNQKLLARVQERSRVLTKANEKGGVQEISGYNEEVDAGTEDVDPEVERFSQRLVARKQESAPEPPPSPAPAPVPTQPSGWQVRGAVRAGRAAADRRRSSRTPTCGACCSPCAR